MKKFRIVLTRPEERWTASIYDPTSYLVTICVAALYRGNKKLLQIGVSHRGVNLPIKKIHEMKLALLTRICRHILKGGFIDAH